MAASDVYEVRCERCRTSFAPETKRCIHCGGPLGRGLGRVLVSGQALPGAAPGAEEAEDDLPFQRGRNILWVVTALIAVVASALRTCAQG